MSEAAAAPPAPRRSRKHRGLWWLLGIVLVIVLAAAGAYVWLFHSEAGTRFALDRASGLAGEGVKLEGVTGTLGGKMHVERMAVERPGLQATLEDVTLDTTGSSPLRRRIQVNDLSARRAEVRTAPDPDEEKKAPTGFSLPASIDVEQARIGELRVGEITPRMQAAKTEEEKRAALAEARAGDQVVRDISLKGSASGDTVKIEEARATTDQGKVRLSGTFQTQGPFRMDAQAQVEGTTQGRKVQAQVTARGPLEKLEVAAEGRVGGQPLSARATLNPFADTPLAALNANASGVDLSQLSDGAPKTRLDIQADLQPEGKGFAGPVRIVNADPGKWDEGKLPLASAAGRVRVTPGGDVALDGATLELAGGGKATGSATFAGGRLATDLRIAGVDLAALHGALQPTDLSGSVKASGDEAAQSFEVALTAPPLRCRNAGR
jgi:translocation and assembly module TamB